MDEHKSSLFLRRSEGMISPPGVARMYQASEFLAGLPLWIQKKMVARGSRKNPYMGFVVEPWSLFLSFPVDPEEVGPWIPRGYRLRDTSFFAQDVPGPRAILGCFAVRTSVFQGVRFELYLIGEHPGSGLPTWLIGGYGSDTVNYEPGTGFRRPNLERCLHTTNFKGQILSFMESTDHRTGLDITASLDHTRRRSLDPSLWVDGNLSVDYSGDLGDGSTEPFGLVFDPREMDSALEIPVEDLDIRGLRFGFLADHHRPVAACTFPWAQHFVTTTFPSGHGLRTRQDLEAEVERLAGDLPG